MPPKGPWPSPPPRGSVPGATAAAGTRALAHKPAVLAIVSESSEHCPGPQRESLVQLRADGGSARQRQRARRRHERQPGAASRELGAGASRLHAAAPPRLRASIALPTASSGRTCDDQRRRVRRLLILHSTPTPSSSPLGQSSRTACPLVRLFAPRVPARRAHTLQHVHTAVGTQSRPSVTCDPALKPHCSRSPVSHVHIHGQQAAGPGVPGCARLQQIARLPRRASWRDFAGLGDVSTPPPRPTTVLSTPRECAMPNCPNSGASPPNGRSSEP